MATTFICKRSGNRVSFTRESDIAAMRKEPGYVEVEEQPQLVPALPEVEPVKRKGRPRKVDKHGVC